MDILSPSFLSALVAIIVIDLVLAGDNAIVIALASRTLPPVLRRRAILWGTVGAVTVRATLTLAVVWLLRIPGLLALGGGLLVWIAYRLLVQPDADGHEIEPAKGFWAAMKTIVVADALMGLDNVLAVAGAAQGSFVLVVTGLVISVPIVVWGSQCVLRVVERYPAVVYLGAGVLAWTAVKMVTGEPMLAGVFAAHPALVPAGYIAVIGGVLATGFVANQRPVRNRVLAHVPASAAAVASADSVLVPVDGSPNALNAVADVLERRRDGGQPTIHLVHVRGARDARRAWYSPLARVFTAGPDVDAFAAARALLHEAGVAHVEHRERGDRADAIRRVAEAVNAGEIVIGTAPRRSLARLVEDMRNDHVINGCALPIRIVPGDCLTPAERIGIPAVLAGVLALLAVGALA